MDNKKRVAILGSTGSIGTQALEVISAQPTSFEAVLLVAGQNVDLLISQALAYQPRKVIIGNPQHYNKLKDALAHLPIAVQAGEQAIAEAMQDDNIDMVLTALVGYAGLLPTMRAIEAGKTIALANKETLVVAGDLIMPLAKKHQVDILPVDSEHSAIFQCWVGEERNPIEKIILTASGGPFRGKKREELASVTKAQALKHPNWSMGAKITIDSASLMNKGLEVIEAKWLFGVEAEQIEVVVHPQSIIHSAIQFEDGSIKAQMERMAKNLSEGLRKPDSISIESDELALVGSSALATLFIANELMYNSFKYNKEKPDLHIRIRMKKVNEQDFSFVFEDNGTGLGNQTFAELSKNRNKGMGLLKAYTQTLKATPQVESSENGLVFRFVGKIRNN
ncbi:MAG: 1-deoxy-D-xylulose-5-phosphate reductoisomerase [Bacteroidetes bacterium]|nr:MAG: 1-deoxy-D-xylulose-5-phosphate reductoisomerase [Bacteroidota bacterium]